MFCSVYPGPELITANPDVSADLSWVDVTKGAELEQEIVVGEGRLCVGYAAVVTCRGQREKASTKKGFIRRPLVQSL